VTKASRAGVVRQVAGGDALGRDDVGGHHLGALRTEQLGHDLAEAAGGPGDDHTASGEALGAGLLGHRRTSWLARRRAGTSEQE
jgi:hypothetical protein